MVRFRVLVVLESFDVNMALPVHTRVHVHDKMSMARTGTLPVHAGMSEAVIANVQAPAGLRQPHCMYCEPAHAGASLYSNWTMMPQVTPRAASNLRIFLGRRKPSDVKTE